MQHLIFYKQNESLREVISQLRFTYDAPYTQYFITNISQLDACVTENVEDCLLFYFAEQLFPSDFKALQDIQETHKGIKIVLLSDPQYALKSWRLNIFHYDAYPVVSDMLYFAYHKWVKSKFNTNSDEELILKTDEGIVKINHSDIMYLQAAGNYTMIHYRGDKVLILTRQLGTFSELSDNFIYFKRIHRSLIVNFSNVKACTNAMVHFYKSNKPLQVSNLLESKIKKILLTHE
jgi:DNA-binding LytR/AlgR family response regulator